MNAAAGAVAAVGLRAEFDPGIRIDAKAEALARLEAAMRDAGQTGKLARANKALRRALSAWRRGDAAKTAKFALAATEADSDNAQAYHLLAIALEKLGYLHKALVTYERAFSLAPDDTDLVLNLGLTAWNAGHLEGAERMFRLYIEKRPDHPAGYNNLSSVLRDRGQLSTAIETLRGAIYRMANEPMLWNSLATVLAEDGRVEECLVFYEEALRLNPDYSRGWHNLGYSYSHLGRLEEALAAYDAALSHAGHPTERLEATHSRSVCLMGMGKIPEGFREYEIRNSQVFRSSVVHYTKAPCWNGENLQGKRILLIGEQGLGDEFMFANIVPDVVRSIGPEGNLQIAVDPRLISLFQRSFPGAEVGGYEDRKLEAKTVRIFPWAREGGEPDFYAPFGTPLQFFRKSVGDFPRQAFLAPDPERSADFRARLAALGPGPYIGICWRSMVLGHLRQKYYGTLDMWKDILTTPGVTFVNLQYGDCAAELDAAREKFGIAIHSFADLDLRNDLEGAAALSDACDLMISAPTAAAALAGAIGRPVWFLVAGRVWPQLGTDHYPWYADTKVFEPERFGDWPEVLPRVAAALAGFRDEMPSDCRALPV